MVYRIKEKFWSWGNSFTITDQSGVPAFQVVGKVFSWGDDLSFQDPHGNQLARITQKLFSWKPRYQILMDDNVFAEVVKEWTWWKKKFTLDVPGPNDYTIDGSFWSHEFTFTRQGRTVARISKKHFSWTDSYGIDIAEGEDVIAILCTCIVIDQVLHDECNNTHHN